MNYLLDTHTFLWFITDSQALSARAKALIESPENRFFLSLASIWEMAIKVSLGKLTMPSPFDDFIELQLKENKFSILDIQVSHIGAVVLLPFHHRDPFDRILIAQATIEGLTIISRDDTFDLYAVSRIW